MRRLLVFLPLILLSCQPVAKQYEAFPRYPVGKSDAVQEPCEEGCGRKAFLGSNSSAETSRPFMKYDATKSAITWQTDVSLAGTASQKISVIVNFYDVNGNMIKEDTADTVEMSPGTKKTVSHDAVMTKDDAARIDKWDIRMRFVGG